MSEVAKSESNVPATQNAKKYLPNLFFLGAKTGDETKEKAKEAGVKVNQFYLKDQHGIVALDPCRIVPTPYKQTFYVKRDPKNYADIVEAREDKQEDRSFVEHTVALAFLLSKDNNPEPVIIKTDKALNRIWNRIDSFAELAEKGGDTWARRGPTAKASAEVKAPSQLKVIAEIGGSTETSEAGYDYNLGHASTTPAPVEVIGKCNSLLKSPEGENAIQIWDDQIAKIVEVLS